MRLNFCIKIFFNENCDWLKKLFKNFCLKDLFLIRKNCISSYSKIPVYNMESFTRAITRYYFLTTNFLNLWWSQRLKIQLQELVFPWQNCIGLCFFVPLSYRKSFMCDITSLVSIKVHYYLKNGIFRIICVYNFFNVKSPRSTIPYQCVKKCFFELIF